MKSLVLVVAIATSAHAEPLGDVVRAQLLPQLPEGTDVAEVHVADRDVDPAKVVVEVPRALKVGRSSVKVSINGKRGQFVQVTIGNVSSVAIAKRSLAVGEVISADEISVELRATDHPVGAAAVGAKVTKAIAAGAPIHEADVVLAPPVARGTQITVEIRRGAVRVHGTGALELAARPGDAATVRLTHTRSIVRGTLVSPSVVEVSP